MFNKRYRIAEKVIAISSLHQRVHELCADYLTDDEPDFEVVMSQDDIEYERIKSEKEDIAEGHEVRRFPDDYLEELGVYRKIATKMVEFDTFLFHGSVIAVDGEGYLFTAKSGTGKSTHTRLWRQLLGDKAVMINDDKPLIKCDGDSAAVFGTPWDGKHRLSTNTSVPLKAVCILERAEKNHIEKISKKDAYNMLVQQIYRPNDPQKLIRTLQLIDRLAGSVTLWRLGCNMDIEAAETAYNAMKG
ncbi:MAG: hypothetical protein MJ100_04540 [Ruminococcus sp.]|nr:hypothetical protein [Ruminococcus sp.]